MNKVSIGRLSVLSNLNCDDSGKLTFRGVRVFSDEVEDHIREAYASKHTHANADTLALLNINSETGELLLEGTPIISVEQLEHLNTAYTASHTHSNGDVLSDLSVDNGKLLLDGVEVYPSSDAEKLNTAYNAIHTHTNKASVDKIGESNGEMTYDGVVVVPSVSKSEWDDASSKRHTHINQTALDKLSDVDGEVAYDGTVIASAASKSAWNDAADKKHTHVNAATLAKLGEQNGQLTFDGEPVVEPKDTLVSLALGVTYDALLVRPDFQDVPVYIIGDNPVVCRLASDSTVGGLAESEIRLMYIVDYITGMPCPALAVTSAGNYLTYFPVTYHAMGKTLTAGWYDENDNPVSGTPTFTNMTFDRLIIGSGDPIRSLDNLSAEARCALETLCRMVNVSVDAMGGLGEKPDGVQRLTNAPQVGRRYAAVTNRNITFSLPELTWSGTERDFWVDLDCTSSIDLTFADTVCYEDGGNVDTTRGKHRLHFYAPAGASVWTVAETESFVEVTEDVVPEYAIPFRNCTADQIRAVLKYGYQNGDGVWCARKYGMEIEFFHVGDKRPVTLIDGREVMMRIIGIDHDDLPGGGKAALTCDFVSLVSVEAFTVDNAEYLNNSLRAVTKSVKDVFPDWLRELLTPVVKVYNENGFNVTDDVWAFSSGETGKSGGVGTAYPIFTDNASRARKNESDNYTRWILRTMASGYYPTETISDIGVFGGAREPEVSDIAVGFCLNV